VARDHGRLRVVVWSDDDFRALSLDAQWAYFAALSQPGVSYAGHVPYTVRRWSGLATDMTATRVRRAVRLLEDRRFVVVDESTEELLIRSFLKHDGILTSPNICKATVKAFRTISSTRLRTAFLVELRRLHNGPQEDHWEKGWPSLAPLLTEPLPEGLPEPLPEGFPEGFEEGSRVRDVAHVGAPPFPSPSQSPSPDPLPPCPHDDPEGPDACPICRTPLAVAGGRGRS
jgi:hypothetical protein